MMTTLDLGSWVILRMASADTLKLVRSLGSAGLTVWTPTERKFGRRPRTRVRYERESAIMPCYAFGHVRCIEALLRLTAMPTSDHPRFQVFHHNGGVPLIADDQLDPLREIERDNASRFSKWVRKGMKAAPLAPGSTVRVPDGAFAGLPGTVVQTKGQYTQVDFTIFGRVASIKVASILLVEDKAVAKAA